MKSFKICLMGPFSVGKTSLVRRFVHEVFDERYVTTLGVTIETREVELDNGAVKLVIWDMEGTNTADQEEELVSSRMRAYLQGVNGVMLVADGTRAVTVQTVYRLQQWLDLEKRGIPTVVLMNKADLRDQWQADLPISNPIPVSAKYFATSALTGKNVERAFTHLAASCGKNK